MSSQPPSQPASNEAVNAQKSRTGLHRVWHATRYSLHGLRAGWSETAFRQEAIAAMVLVPPSTVLNALSQQMTPLLDKQIEIARQRKTLAKLRHPMRSQRLKEFLEEE